MNELKLEQSEIDYLLSPAAIRERSGAIFELTRAGKTAFLYRPGKLAATVDLVLRVIRKNYPSFEIPFHSRWGHFRAGGINRFAAWEKEHGNIDSFERARIRLDLIIPSVLLDAGAGTDWGYKEPGTKFPLVRSEGLGVASLNMFISGAMSSNRKEIRSDTAGLKKITAADIRKYFQVTAQNPLVGVEGRALLLNNLGEALENETFFPGGRPGGLVDYFMKTFRRDLPAIAVLRTVLKGLGSIWPGRIQAGSVNLGDVWEYRGIAGDHRLIPFHKLSQWMTYSLLEPLEEAGFNITGLNELTGLAEYRNGGLMLDSGLIVLRNPSDAKKTWRPDSDLIIEWRALTIHLLDLIATDLQQALGKTPDDFPLVKVLEGGTWAAGRSLAADKRPGSAPPLKLDSDGTVF